MDHEGLTNRSRSWSPVSARSLTKTPGQPDVDVRTPFASKQSTWSEGHPYKGAYDGYDCGGPFESHRVRYVRVDYRDVVVPSFAGAKHYLRLCAAAPPFGTTPTYVSSTMTDTVLLARGTTAIAQTRPTAPLAGLGVTLGELREGLPKIVGAGLLKTRLSDLRSVPKRGSDEYLNWEFGWKPLLKDLRDSCRSVKNAEKILAQLHRDNGKLVRRKFGFPRESTVSVTETTAYGYPTVNVLLYQKAGRLRTTTETRSDVWFKGAFRYHIPDQTTMLNKMSSYATEANRLLGLRPDPELLWNLAPWTWLTDWYGNMGDLMANLSSFAFDGLVLEYGYAMNHYSSWVSQSLEGLALSGRTFNLTTVGVKEHKRRLRATPFGFGIELSDLSDWQLSILAALGISKSRFH